MPAYPIDVPDHALLEIIWAHRSAVAVSTSPFTYNTQVFRHAGQSRRVTCKLPPLSRRRAQAWTAFFLRLNGREGTFRLGCSIRRIPEGTGLGSPTIDGAGQTGDTIQTAGWHASTPEVLVAGDLIQIGDRLHDILTDAATDSAGRATLDIWPRITTAHADGAAITYLEPRGIFRLDAIPDARWTLDRFLTGLTFTASEVI